MVFEFTFYVRLTSFYRHPLNFCAVFRSWSFCAYPLLVVVCCGMCQLIAVREGGYNVGRFLNVQKNKQSGV